MLIENVIGTIKDYPVGARKIDRVMLEWFEMDKKLLRKKSEAGEEVGFRLKTHLHEGDILYADDARVLVADILPCELAIIDVTTKKEMGRLCFELGNRHLSLAIEENQVSIPYDEPTFLYLKKLGFAVRKEDAKFSHFTVCHAHAHTHEAQRAADEEHTHVH